MKISRILFFCAMLAPAIVANAADSIVLAERGKAPSYSIMIGANASVVEVYAAEELRTWTERVTGVALSIVRDSSPLPSAAILLGETRYTAATLGVKDLAADFKWLGDDGFRLVVRGNRLVALGSRKRGALYAAYEILRRFGGVEWFASWHTLAEPRDAMRVPSGFDCRERPAFQSREPFWYDVISNHAFAARLRANALSWRTVDPKFGIGEFRFGGGLGSCHTFARLCPTEKYFDAHPEYFSMVKGKRIKDHTQLCLTNPEVLDIVTSNVLAAIKSDPGAKYYGVSQNDWQNWCECPKCKAIDDEEESHAGTMVRFVNAIAERVEKVYPDKVIETLAYQYTRKAPKKTRLRHNVMPCLCTIECDFTRPIPESQVPKTHEFVDIFRSWSAQTDQLYVWDYTTDFHHFTMPFPNVFALQGNIRFFRDNKVVSLFEQGAYKGRHADFAELKAWLLAKWMWNPDLDMRKLLDQFFVGYFGKAAPFARAYFDEVHARQFAQSSGADRPLGIFDDISSTCVNGEFLNRATELWRKAAQAVKNEPAVYAYNVKMAALPTDYAYLSKRMKKFWVTRHPERFVDVRDAAALAKDFLARVDEGKVRLSEVEGPDRAIRERIAAFAAGGANPVACDIAGGHASAFGPNGNAKLVDDPTADGGKAICLGNGHYEWSGKVSFGEVAYDADALYKVRFRIRVERDKDAKPGEIFWAGVYDSIAKRYVCRDIRLKSDAAKGTEWFWCETKPFKPTDSSYIWLAPGMFDRKKHAHNPALKATFADRFEIVRVE